MGGVICLRWRGMVEVVIIGAEWTPIEGHPEHGRENEEGR